MENELEKLVSEERVGGPYELVVKPGEITYGIMTFKNFDAREVLVEGKPTGEIHIKPKVNTTIEAAVAVFTKALVGFKVGGIYMEGLPPHAIEYPVYAKPYPTIGDLIAGDTANVLQSVDDYIEQINRAAY